MTDLLANYWWAALAAVGVIAAFLILRGRTLRRQ